MFFTYDNKNSKDFGVIIGRAGGVDDIPLIANNNLVYDETPHKYYHYGVTKDLLEFNWLIVPIDGYWKNGQLDSVVDWLNADDFKRFTIDMWPGKVLYLKPLHMTLGGQSYNASYIDITFTNISPYYYSDVITHTIDTSIDVANNGIDDIISKFIIKSHGGDIAITNMKDTIIIKNTLKDDVITLDNYNGLIYSEKDDNISSKYNGVILNFDDKNTIKVDGNADIEIVYQEVFDSVR